MVRHSFNVSPLKNPIYIDSNYIEIPFKLYRKHHKTKEWLVFCQGKWVISLKNKKSNSSNANDLFL